MIERMAGFDIYLAPAMLDARETDRVGSILSTTLTALKQYQPKAAT